MMIQGKLLSYGNDLTEVIMIRRKVFIEEMKLPEEAEYDGLDDMAIHVIVYEEAASKQAVATGRLCFDGICCELGHIGVLKEFRFRKYGDFAVRMLLNKAFTADIIEVKTIVLAETVPFFEKIGFHKCGEIFEYLNRNCYKMSINKNDIITACQK